MTDQQHPITPPPELVRQWLEDSPEDDELGISGYIATQAARWGADQELEACITWVAIESLQAAKELRAARRPKPPSLKEQAIEILGLTQKGYGFAEVDLDIIRRALEQLPDDQG